MEILTTALAKLGFDWQIALANLVNFALVFWLLNKFVFKNLRSKLNERADMIQEGVNNVIHSETLLQQAREESVQLLDQARRDAAEKSAHLIKTAEQLATSITDGANKESRELLAESQAKAIQQSQEILAETKQKAVSMIIDATERVLREKLIGNQDEYIKRVI